MGGGTTRDITTNAVMSRVIGMITVIILVTNDNKNYNNNGDETKTVNMWDEKVEWYQTIALAIIS